MRKPFPRIWFIAAMLIFPSLAQLHAAELWVSPDGAPGNPGTQDQPMQSVADALRAARELRRRGDASIKDGVHIKLRGGRYTLTEPLFIRPEDSGAEDSPTIIEAAEGETPVLSGGVVLGGWRMADETTGVSADARDHVWFSALPQLRGRSVECRQLWVGDRKAIRARVPNGDQMQRLIEWDRTAQEAWIPAGDRSVLIPNGSEMTILQQWEIAILRIKSLRIEGEKARVKFETPESRVEFEHPWPQPIIKEGNNAPFFLSGAVEFLDQAGEWAQEGSDDGILYWPREGEDVKRIESIVPALENLVQVVGSLDRPVSNVIFKNIRFEHSAWTRPSRAGHVPLQAGMAMTDAYKLTPKGTPDWRSLDNQAWVERMPAAVTVKNANHIRFEGCQFEHLAASGLDFISGTYDDVIEGCVFRDIGGNGIQMGSFNDGNGVEAHLPYDPADTREVCTRERIANNLVTDCANEDWGCVGIAVGFAREVSIEHNELFNLSYTGISLGWGWTRTLNAMRNNRVRANHIHHIATRMADTGGIYTLSAQPGTIISENSIHDIKPGPWSHDPNHWSYIYLDEGSSYMTVRDNWCPEEKFQKNANGPGNTWENNGPAVSQDIKNAAGLEPAFRELTSEHETK